MSEVRHALLRRDALSAAKEALYHLDVLVSGQLQSAAALPPGDAGPVELLEEFVFQALQERGGAQPKRTPAVYCVRLARALVDDYCSLGPGSVQTLQHIFSASPRFCCQFITAVAMLYDLSSDELIPSPDLLEMIVSWIFEDPRLILITFLNTPIVTSPPIGFLELTPLCGLICWCVKAPLAYKRRKLPPSNGALGGKMDLPDSFDRDCHLLYSKLHLSILQVLMLLQGHLTEKNLYGRLGLVTGEQMASLVEDVRLLSDKLNPLHAAKEIELALDRLAQVLQVAMASGVLLWTRENLRTVCSGLPHNNLLQLVILGPVQPPAHAALPPGFYPPIHTPPLGYPTHAAHPAHPVQAFMPGMAFPYRPIR
ncbi:integrator complex subunit 15 isoform X3 [Pantherophis guttatus]|uniref:Integrator complex subunit 15 isoform X3 n=1 Tax=Pantherophis guttatus TaxID=94885 RepID=A0A6P9DN25_PANGU|nr:integrator complex subunit 15 isoform X3 [Pantherophis guttatus]